MTAVELARIANVNLSSLFETARQLRDMLKEDGKSTSEIEDSTEYEYYIVHDGSGISHVMRHKKGVHPATRCADCD